MGSVPATGTALRCVKRNSAILARTGARFAPEAGAPLMATIAATLPRSRSRFLLDKPQIIGPLFIAPAILYVLILVALPFLLAIYYSVSAYTIFDPNYRFVGWS